MESTLATFYDELRSEVSDFLGWGLGPAFGGADWSAYQKTTLERLLKSGIRQVNDPKPLEGEAAPHRWSWLHPTANLALASGAQTINLPDDFAGFEGLVTVLGTATSTQPYRIQWRNIAQLRQLYSEQPTTTGPPMFVASEWVKGTGPTAGQRSLMLVFPIADAAYTLQVQYYLLPDLINGANPYPLGGASMSELYREACLMAAENFKDDASTIHTMKFDERLAAAIGSDRRHKPQSVGYNRDRSDAVHALDHREVHGWGPPMTYMGQSFD